MLDFTFLAFHIVPIRLFIDDMPIEALMVLPPHKSSVLTRPVDFTDSASQICPSNRQRPKGGFTDSGSALLRFALPIPEENRDRRVYRFRFVGQLLYLPITVNHTAGCVYRFRAQSHPAVLPIWLSFQPRRFYRKNFFTFFAARTTQGVKAADLLRKRPKNKGAKLSSHHGLHQDYTTPRF